MPKLSYPEPLLNPGALMHITCRGLLLSLLGLAFSLEASAEIAPFPGAQMISRDEGGAVGPVRILNGPVERVDGEEVPEAFEFVQGALRQAVWLLPKRPPKVFAAHYASQLETAHEVIFTCEDRACGSSNYWANNVFNNSRLYGPARDQHYLLGRAADRYTMIYLARRATGQAFVLVQELMFSAEPLEPDQSELVTALLEKGVYTIADEADIAGDARALLQLAADTQLAIVVHDALKAGESLEDGIRRTQQKAEALKATFLANGVPAAQLDAHGVGPLAPAAETSRTELVLISE